jgi:hypothetical protein
MPVIPLNPACHGLYFAGADPGDLTVGKRGKPSETVD